MTNVRPNIEVAAVEPGTTHWFAPTGLDTCMAPPQSAPCIGLLLRVASNIGSIVGFDNGLQCRHSSHNRSSLFRVFYFCMCSIGCREKRKAEEREHRHDKNRERCTITFLLLTDETKTIDGRFEPFHLFDERTLRCTLLYHQNPWNDTSGRNCP